MMRSHFARRIKGKNKPSGAGDAPRKRKEKRTMNMIAKLASKYRWHLWQLAVIYILVGALAAAMAAMIASEVAR